MEIYRLHKNQLRMISDYPFWTHLRIRSVDRQCGAKCVPVQKIIKSLDVIEPENGCILSNYLIRPRGSHGFLIIETTERSAKVLNRSDRVNKLLEVRFISSGRICG